MSQITKIFNSLSTISQWQIPLSNWSNNSDKKFKSLIKKSYENETEFKLLLNNCKTKIRLIKNIPTIEQDWYQIFALHNYTILRANDSLNDTCLTLVFASYDHHLQMRLEHSWFTNIEKDKKQRRENLHGPHIVSSKNLPVPNKFLSSFPTHFKQSNESSYLQKPCTIINTRIWGIT